MCRGCVTTVAIVEMQAGYAISSAASCAVLCPRLSLSPTWEFVFAPKRGAHLIGSRAILDTPLKFKIIMWLRLNCQADYCPS